MIDRRTKLVQLAIESDHDASGKAIALKALDRRKPQPRELVKSIIKAMEK